MASGPLAAAAANFYHNLVFSAATCFNIYKLADQEKKRATLQQLFAN